MTEPRELYQSDQIERWWVAFSDGDPALRQWWRPFIKPGFRHVLAFRALSGDCVLFVHPLLHRIEQGVRFETPAAVLAHCRGRGFRVVVVERAVRDYDPARDRQVGRGCFVTCATVIAYLVGIDFRGRWTPWQLWKALKIAGAEELHVNP